MTLESTLLYPVYLLISFILTLIFIPREDYKNYFIYGLLIGGLGDLFFVTLLQNVLHIMWFKNLGMFNVLGQMALSPPCWTLTIMLFLYFLPTRRYFLHLYVIIWTFYSLAFGYIVQNARLFDFLPWFYPIPSYLLFLSWWTFAAWIFIKTNPVKRN